MFNIGDKARRNVLVSSDHGLLIVNRFDYAPIGISGSILDHGNNNTVEADATMKALRGVDSPIIFDVGANLGTYASWVAKWFEPVNGKVYCFEPQRIIFQMLCGNMAINNIFNVYAYELALGSEEKYIEIDEVNYDEPGGFGSFSLDGVEREKYKTILGKKQRIKLTTIDKFVEENQIPKIDFIKIDAEGLDIDVIAGAPSSIEKFKPDLYVEYLNLGSSKKEDTLLEGKQYLVSVLNTMGYETFEIGHDIFGTAKGHRI